MFNFSMSLMGIDIIPSDNNYQFWILSIKNWDNETNRALFAVGIIEDELIIEILFVRLLG